MESDVTFLAQSSTQSPGPPWPAVGEREALGASIENKQILYIRFYCARVESWTRRFCLYLLLERSWY